MENGGYGCSLSLLDDKLNSYHHNNLQAKIFQTDILGYPPVVSHEFGAPDVTQTPHHNVSVSPSKICKPPNPAFPKITDNAPRHCFAVQGEQIDMWDAEFLRLSWAIQSSCTNDVHRPLSPICSNDSRTQTVVPSPTPPHPKLPKLTCHILPIHP